jgi:hypothetical protein
MHHRWRALVGFAVLALVVNVAGPRTHLHPVDLDQFGRALLHSHGAGEPHSHDRAPSTPGDEGEPHDPVIVLGAARVLLPPSSVATPAAAATVAAGAVWTLAPDTTPVHSHGPPSARLLPARAPPLGLLLIS